MQLWGSNSSSFEKIFFHETEVLLTWVWISNFVSPLLKALCMKPQGWCFTAVIGPDVWILIMFEMETFKNMCFNYRHGNNYFSASSITLPRLRFFNYCFFQCICKQTFCNSARTAFKLLLVYNLLQEIRKWILTYVH